MLYEDAHDAQEKLEGLFTEVREILGMVREIKAKIRLYQSVDDFQREKLMQGSSEEKMYEDLNRYMQRFDEISKETDEIIKRINV